MHSLAIVGLFDPVQLFIECFALPGESERVIEVMLEFDQYLKLQERAQRLSIDFRQPDKHDCLNNPINSIAYKTRSELTAVHASGLSVSTCGRNVVKHLAVCVVSSATVLSRQQSGPVGASKADFVLSQRARVDRIAPFCQVFTKIDSLKKISPENHKHLQSPCLG